MLVPLTLYVVRRLKLEDLILNVIGPINITQSTLDVFIEHRDEAEELKGVESMSVHFKDGTYYKDVRTPEQIKNVISIYRDDVIWIRKNCSIIPVEGQLPHKHAKNIARILDQASLDTILAANDKKFLLVTEDFGLRVFAKELVGHDGVWLQPVLLIARKKGVISSENYSGTVATLINAGHSFITVDSAVLFDIANKSGWKITDDLRRVLETLGATTSDIDASIPVAANFLVAVWEEGVRIDKLRNLTFAVLNALISNHWNLAGQITSALWKKSVSRIQFRENFNQAILDWIRGHFLDPSI